MSRKVLSLGRRYRIGEITVGLRSARPEFLDDFDDLYRANRTDAAPAKPSIEMEIKRRSRPLIGAATYSIHADGREIFTNRRAREVLPYLEWGINRGLTTTRPEFLQIHAATLSLQGVGVAFPGHSGQGKSTLAAGLLSRDWQLLTDEMTLIHPDSGIVHPFPKALCIKTGSLEVVERLGLPLWRRRHYVKTFKGPVAYLNPRDVGANAVGGPLPIRFVIFPEYTPGACPRLWPVPRARAAYLLAAHAFNRREFGSRTVSVLARTVREAECYALQAGELDETCALIESLI